MWRAYGDPRGAMARQIAAGLGESRAFLHLTLACALGFVASLPEAARTARRLDIPDPIEGAFAAHLFGYLFVLPLLLYGLAALVHLAARVFGGGGGFLGARAALFWTALLAGPIALALALAGLGAELAGAPRLLPTLDYLGYAGASFWLWLFAATLAEAEGFVATRRVVAVVAVVVVAVVFGVGSVPDAAPAAG